VHSGVIGVTGVKSSAIYGHGDSEFAKVGVVSSNLIARSNHINRLDVFVVRVKSITPLYPHF